MQSSSLGDVKQKAPGSSCQTRDSNVAVLPRQTSYQTIRLVQVLPDVLSRRRMARSSKVKALLQSGGPILLHNWIKPESTHSYESEVESQYVDQGWKPDYPDTTEN